MAGTSFRVVGISATAAVLLLLAGTLQFLEGLAAIIAGDYFITGANFTYTFDLASWGWIHLVTGILAWVIAVGVLRGAVWARSLGVAIAIIGATANFMWLPYQPGWSVILIGLYGLVIWSLTSGPRTSIAGAPNSAMR